MTRFVRIKRRGPGLMPSALIALASIAHALPVELKDQNGTKYEINTQVDPLLRDSNASGAITNATYVKPVTVTSYFVGFTPFGFFLTTETVQRQVNIPLTNAFAGFKTGNLPTTGAHGVALPQPQAFIPARRSLRRNASRVTRTGSSPSRHRPSRTSTCRLPGRSSCRTTEASSAGSTS